jgi:hypothetical protein
LRLNAKIRLNPSLKDLVINIDEDKYEDEEKTQVSRRKRTKQQKEVRKNKTEHLLEEKQVAKKRSTQKLQSGIPRKMAKAKTIMAEKSKRIEEGQPSRLDTLIEVVETLK